MRPRPESLIGGAGVVAAAVAVLADPHAARLAASQTWSPFVLVTGLILIGLAAEEDGVFRLCGRGLASLAEGELPFVLGSAALCVVVTATLNLDTSVVFVTPVVLAAARHRGRQEGPVLYGSLLMANAGSLFLPGSNLTNMIVLGHGASGGAFLGRIWPAALAASVVTALVLAVWSVRMRRSDAPRPTGAGEPVVLRSGAAAVVAAVILVLVLASPALPVLAVGLLVSAARVLRGQLGVDRIRMTLTPPVLIGLFGLAVAMGTLGRTWSGPNVALSHLGLIGTAALGAATSLLINNLPAAALLASHHPTHPAALLVGLDLGPNLFVTGSLAWFLWFRIATAAGARPSLRQATRLGVVVVPLSMAASLTALWLA